MGHGSCVLAPSRPPSPHAEGVSDVFAAMHAAASGGQLMGDYTPFLGAAAAHFSQV